MGKFHFDQQEGQIDQVEPRDLFLAMRALLLTNFEQQSIVSREEVRAAVLALPMTHIRGIQVIRYDPHRLIATSLAHATGTSSPISSHGLFYTDGQLMVIVLFRFYDYRSFSHVLYHEIGHYVYLRAIFQHDRDEWMYRVRKEEPDSVTDYGNKNSREDFAESYAYWCTRREDLKAYPMRYAFFAERIFVEE